MTGETTKNLELSVSGNGNDLVLPKRDSSEISLADAPTIYSIYHTSEIEQNTKIYKTAKGIIWAGFSVIMLSVIIALFGKTTTAIITACAGIITEFISSIIFVFLSNSSKSKLTYYQQLSLDEESKRYIQVINTLKDEDKVACINKLIDNYCDRRK